ncbi:Scr1 family TA system antitoxin-like transcriptional regulator [Saccharopolyspora sp. ASAGF58]|uniref:Scr1 family TA system antitoxin-like transcriptional regulator n=1 Tax=Saccharopolyspora sp. ASAGF58 TaxID=2719023 RepID=UPI00352FF173
MSDSPGFPWLDDLCRRGRAQLLHLLEVAKQVGVQVMPTSVGAHAGMDRKFILLEFDNFGPTRWRTLC